MKRHPSFSVDIANEFAKAYVDMVQKAKYRPMVETWDGDAIQNLPQEAVKYGEMREEAESEGFGLSGFDKCSYETAKETIIAMEAAHMLCAAEPEWALKLLDLATSSLRKKIASGAVKI